MYGIYAKTMKMIKGGMHNTVADHHLLAQTPFVQNSVKTHISSKAEHFSASDLRPALLLFPLFLAMAFCTHFSVNFFECIACHRIIFHCVSVLMLAAQGIWYP